MCVTLHMINTLLNAILVILLRPGSDEILNPLQFVIFMEVVTKGLSRHLLLYFEEWYGILGFNVPLDTV